MRTSIIGVAVALLALSGCGKGTARTLPPDVKAAMDKVEDPATAQALQGTSGSVAGLVGALDGLVPEVQALVTGGDDTQAALQDAFSGEASVDDDLALTTYAWALEQRGATGAIATLRTWLAANLAGDAEVAPHVVAHAVFALAGTPDPVGDAYWYVPTDLAAASTGGTTSLADALGPGGQGAGASTERDRACGRQLVLVDGDGEPLYYDDDGIRRKAVLGGREHTADTLTPDMEAHWRAMVTDGGGTYVDEGEGWVGRPTRRFNCAGYAFRAMNDGRPWTADPGAWFKVLKGVGALRRIEDDAAVLPGDLVFYFQSGGDRLPGHVASVHTVEPGLLYGQTITIRNGETWSGLWEADIDASYFSRTIVENGTSRPLYARREVWRYVGEPPVKPVFADDPTYAQSQDNCDNIDDEPEPCTGSDCEVVEPTDGPAGTIFLGTAPAGDLAELSTGLYAIAADDGSYDLITKQAVDGVAVSPDNSWLAAGMMSGTGVMAGDPGLKILDVSNGGWDAYLAVVTMLPWDSGPQELTYPTWRSDSSSLVVSRSSSDLHAYELEEEKGSLKLMSGYRAACSRSSMACVVETSDGPVLMHDSDAGIYGPPHEPWNLEAWGTYTLTEEPSRFTKLGAAGDTDLVKPKWCGDGVLMLKTGARDEVHWLKLTSDERSIEARTVMKVPSGRVGAATCSPNGAWVVYAITETEDADGGLWIMPMGQAAETEHLLATDFSALWHVDLAWTWID